MSAAPLPAPNPLLIDLPEELTGPRVRGRPYRDTDGDFHAARAGPWRALLAS